VILASDVSSFVLEATLERSAGSGCGACVEGQGRDVGGRDVGRPARARCMLDLYVGGMFGTIVAIHG
jgi:hypothetical protein